MSLRIYVDAYSGYRADERPRRFWLDAVLDGSELTGVYEIEAVEDRWYDPNAEYFRVRTTELLARPGIELVTVEPTAIRAAESKVAGCERCRADESDIPFDWILADVLGKHGAFDFILSELGRCPNCRAELSEKTLVEPQGGNEVETMA